MNIHERIETFWSGEKPDRIPYAIYHNEWKHFAGDPAREAMFRNGLGVVYHNSCFEEKTDGPVEYARNTYTENGRAYECITARTPAGDSRLRLPDTYRRTGKDPGLSCWKY